MIHLNPRACDGRYLTLFQRDLLLAHEEVDSGVADVVLKYFVEHCSQWMSPENVALSLHSDSPPMSFDAAKTSTSLPASGNVFVRSPTLKLGIFIMIL